MKTKLPKLIGVIHLEPLPSSPGAMHLGHDEAIDIAGRFAVQEAQLLERAGFEAVIVENFGDAPFYKDHVGPDTVSSMAIITSALTASVRIPVGVNILRNDALSAHAVAACSGASFIRVNVLAGVVATDQGLLEGCAAELLRVRAQSASGIGILADLDVKHAKSLHARSVASGVEELVGRCGADALIVTGETTGRAPELAHLKEVVRHARDCGAPVYVGSGVSAENVSSIRRLGAHIIISSSLRKDGRPGARIDSKRLSVFLRALKKA